MPSLALSRRAFLGRNVSLQPQLPVTATFPEGVTRFISAHVQGSCRMSLDAGRGVVDQDHRVQGLRSIFVVDASVMPTTASTHGMIPVMALADRAVHAMLDRHA